MIYIVGQGLAGTWLSYFLYKKGVPFRVIDDGDPQSSSRIAGGVMNPVTGRRMVETWMSETLFPFAFKQYSAIGNLLNESLIEEIPIYDFFSSPDRKLVFDKRFAENDIRLSVPEDQELTDRFFNAPFGYGCIHGAYLVHLQTMLKSWRAFLEERQLLENKKTDTMDYQIWLENNDKVIFSTGSAAAAHPLFSLLPFSPTKGECLILKIPELPAHALYKKQFALVPWQNNTWWAGSNYLHQYSNTGPDPAFYQALSGWLRSFLKVPFEILSHFAAIRPTTVDRRPFAGFHPLFPNLGILNGLGTKGVSLAPWLACLLTEKIVGSDALPAEVDIARFRKILSRADY